MNQAIRNTIKCALFITIALILNNSVYSQQSGTDGEIAWNLDQSGLLTISKNSGNGVMKDYASDYNCGSTAPWALYRSSFTALAIQEGVTKIGDYAFFECTGFTGNLTLPAGITRIGWNAFTNCSGFTGNLTLSDELEVIDNGAFQGCSNFQGYLTLPDGVEYIGQYTFSGSGFSTVNFNSINCQVYIGVPSTPVFDNCNNLKQLNIGNGVKTIPECMFSQCTSLTGNLVLPDGLESIGNYAFEKCGGFSGDLILPAGLSDIGLSAFSHCNGFTSVINKNPVPQLINESVFLDVNINAKTLYVPSESVEDYGITPVWADFQSIEPMFVPVSYITNLPSNAMVGVPLTLAGTVEPSNATYQTITWSIYSAGNTGATITNGNILNTTDIGTVEITATIENGMAPDKEYKHNFRIAVTLPIHIITATITYGQGSINPAGDVQVYQGDDLTFNFTPDKDFRIMSVLIDNVENQQAVEDGYYQFTNVISDHTIAVAFGLMDCETYYDGTAGNLTWQFCDGLLTISGNDYMPNYTSPYIPTPKFLNAIKGKNSKDNSPWDDLGEIIVIVIVEDGVQSVGNYAYSGFGNMINVSLPELGSITSIGEGSFAYSESLSSITIPASVTTIGDGAFVYCSELESITVDSTNLNYTSNNGVLFNNDLTTLIQFPAGKEELSYTIPETVSKIGNYAFAGNVSVEQVVISSSVSNIGEGSFANCGALAKISVDDNNPVYSDKDGVLFNKNGNRLIQYPPGRIGEEYVISANVTEIESWAFSNCIYLIRIIIEDNNPKYSSENGILFNYDKTVIIRYPTAIEDESYIIPSSVNIIGDYCFSGNKNLRSVTIPASVARIGDYTFWECHLTEVISLSKIPPVLGRYVFYGMDGSKYYKNSAATLYVPYGAKNSYIQAGYGVYFSNIEEMANIREISVEQYKIYPNPVKDKLTIVRTNAGKSKAKVEIYNTIGLLLVTQHFEDYATETHVDVSALPSGIYFVAIEGKTVKVIKN